MERFENPNIRLEQYTTDAISTADLLFFIGLDNGDLLNNLVIDLGAGTGRICLGALLFGALGAVAIEKDPAAVSVLKRNREKMNLNERCLIIERDVAQISAQIEQSDNSDNYYGSDDLNELFKEFRIEVEDYHHHLTDTYVLENNAESEELTHLDSEKVCIMNPPFGIHKRGADKPFLNLAMAVSDKIYSIHYSGEKNRKYLTRFIEKRGWMVENIFSQKLAVEGCYKFHKMPQKDVLADIYKLEKKKL